MKRVFKIISFLCIFMFINNINAYSFDEGKDISNNYINNNRKNIAYLINTSKIPFGYNNKTISYIDGFNTGGFINIYEVNTSKLNNATYLTTSLPYFSIDGKVINDESSNNSNIRVTEFVKRKTKIIGNGSYKDPWKFVPYNLLEVSSSDENKGTVSPSYAFVYDGEDAIFTVTPKTGYKYYSSTCTNIIVNNDKITFKNINKDEKCTINFIENKVKLTYNNNGGSGCSSKDVSYGLNYGELCTPVKSGYDFMGWYTSLNGGEKISPSSVVTSTTDHTIYARWEGKVINKDAILSGYKCNNITVGNAPYIMTYTGNCEVTGEVNGEFKIKLLTSGTFRLNGEINVDIFAVGGGGGGSYTTGGGGGYTDYKQSVTNIVNQDFNVTIGNGGGIGGNGGNTDFPGIISVSGGGAGGTNGGNGGSGGGGHGGTTREWGCTSYWDQGGCAVDDQGWPVVGWIYSRGNGGNGGSFGNSGTSGQNVEITSGGYGQGRTTCEFNEGTLGGCYNGNDYAYSAGGLGCGDNINGYTGTGKTGNNSGRGGNCGSAGNSGVIVIRSRNNKDIIVGSKVIGTYDGKFTTEGDENNWIVRFLTDGTLRFKENMAIDAFAVGGGGGGSSTSGGGGGYTNYIPATNVTANIAYSITVGRGGETSSKGGDSTLSSIITASGGGGASSNGGNGGSGGGGYGGTHSEYGCTLYWDQGGCAVDFDGNPVYGFIYTYGNGGNGGAFGNAGTMGTVVPTNGGNGQGTTTCEFNEGNTSGCTRGNNYAYSAGGYGCGTKVNGKNGTGKTGSNSGGGGECSSAGYTGIIAIRNKR